MAHRVFVVGSYNQDHAWTCTRLPQPGETLSGRYHGGPGGKGFNQAVAAARSGASTCFIAALGEDAAASTAFELAARFGIDMRVQRVSDAPTGTAAILVDEAGRNQIVVAPGANALLTCEWVEAALADLGAGDVLLAQLEVAPDAVQAALALARARGARTLLNPAPADVAPGFGGTGLADILTPNETEFVALLAGSGPLPAADAVAGLDDDSLQALCRRLPAPIVVVTLGAAGCFVSLAGNSDAPRAWRVAPERVQAVDTTGAGDAFNGALAAALAGTGGCGIAEAVRAASRYAALSTERAGAALAMPSIEEVAARFGDARP